MKKIFKNVILPISCLIGASAHADDIPIVPFHDPALKYNQEDVDHHKYVAFNVTLSGDSSLNGEGQEYHYQPSADNINHEEIDTKMGPLRYITQTQFKLKKGSSYPTSLTISENTFSDDIDNTFGKFNCAEIDYKNKQFYTQIGAKFTLDNSNFDTTKPVQLTIFPFHSDNDSCSKPMDDSAFNLSSDVKYYDDPKHYALGTLSVFISREDEFDSELKSDDPALCTIDSSKIDSDFGYDNKQLTLEHMHEWVIAHNTNKNGTINWEYKESPVVSNSCHLEVPHWELKTINGHDFIEFKGTLTNWASKPKSSPEDNNDMNINIPLHSSLSIPMTTQFIRIPVKLDGPTTNEDSCRDALQSLNKVMYLRTRHSQNYNPNEIADVVQACNIEAVENQLESEEDIKTPTGVADGSDRNFTYSARANKSIHIFGLGRINGYTHTYRTRWGMGADFNPKYPVIGFRSSTDLGSIWNIDGNYRKSFLNYGSSDETTYDKNVRLGKLIEFARYHIESSLLGLDNTREFTGWVNREITVKGITLSGGEKRNHGAAQINVAQFGAASEDIDYEVYGRLEDREADNNPVHVFDVKELGFWQNCVDGMDIGSDNSTMDYIYGQTADDNMKLEAKNQRVTEYTALQGESGAVVMASMYGVQRDALTGSTIENVYVPFVINKFLDNKSDPTYGWYYGSGLITNRNTDRMYQGSKSPSTEVTPGGWSVNNFYVLSHTQNDSNDCAHNVYCEPSAMTLVSKAFNIQDGEGYNGDFSWLAFEPRAIGVVTNRQPISLTNIDLGGQQIYSLYDYSDWEQKHPVHDQSNGQAGFVSDNWNATYTWYDPVSSHDGYTFDAYVTGNNQ
ncbi:hypothetical protein CF386_08810 [Paraphotobacterium marinum]|uniref:Uncharacterized protein n=1 Tax=Paraphotobacterium marinum TaxID=1755811 RepID=A0A220VFX7_9GAMM|nr:hypothetical protein [Paraphotobacterium marinum]ASK79160.1 hypothetical protein CF386_08810 [Paraphotobacterium marinum]